MSETTEPAYYGPKLEDLLDEWEVAANWFYNWEDDPEVCPYRTRVDAQAAGIAARQRLRDLFDTQQKELEILRAANAHGMTVQSSVGFPPRRLASQGVSPDSPSSLSSQTPKEPQK